jgi:hypothetical protein
MSGKPSKKGGKMATKRASRKFRFPRWDDPIEQQLRFNGKDIGSIYLRFNPRKSKKDWPREECPLNEVTKQFQLHFQGEFLAMVNRFQREMEIYFDKFDEVHRSNALYLSRRELLDYLISRERMLDFTAYSGYLYSDDAAFYSLLESEGAEILANSGSLWRIRLAQREKNGVALIKIAESLIAGFHPTKGPRKPGPHPRVLEKKKVRVLYDYVLLRMEWMKEHRDWKVVDQKEKEFLEEVKLRINHWKKLDQGWNEFPDDPKMRGRYLRTVDQAAKALITDRKPEFTNPVKAVAWWLRKKGGYNVQLKKCIDSDKKLRRDFEGDCLVPHEMAKKICSSLLGISESGLHKILWGPHKSGRIKDARNHPVDRLTN